MCLIIFRWQPDCEERLLLIGNRDEFYARPSEQARYWTDKPDLLAGRDIRAGGTWLGIDQKQRFCTVTNYRQVPGPEGTNSRGEIPVDFIESGLSAKKYAHELMARGELYSGYNALLYDGKDLAYITNRSDWGVRVLEPGDYALSNHLLNTPWPKTERLTSLFRQSIEKHSSEELRNEALLNIMQDQQRPDDQYLPNTGIGLEAERLLSSIFIASEHYGTRTTSLISLKGRRSHFIERNYDTSSSKKTDSIDYSDAAFTIEH